MNKWTEEVSAYLETKNYEKLVSYYEELLENNPDDITNYWYLGLSYLLAENDAEAQTTWFIPFGDANQEATEIFVQELSQILNNEAYRLEKNQDYDKAWLVRNALQEINPSFLENLLILLKLSIILKYFEPQWIKEWGILDLLEAKQFPFIEINLLLDVLDQVLKVPLESCIEFAEKCLIYTDTNSQIGDKIASMALVMGFDHYYAHFAVELLSLHTKFFPDSLSSYRDLNIFYRRINDEIKALEIGKIIEEKSDSLEGKILGVDCQFISACMSSQWHLIYELRDKQIQYWEEIIRKKETLQNPLVKDCLLPGIMCFLYVEDNLIKHRYLFNKISDFFYRSNKINKNIFYSQKEAKKVLKIGYIGSTFRYHSVAFLCRWLIKYHDPELFEVNIYSVQGNQDSITQEWFMPPMVKQFYNAPRDPQMIIDKIASDQVDILIDLDSVTCNLTNIILSQKLAPIQLTWLGLDASGLPTIDYYIADPYVLPDYAQKYYSEKIWRLPHTYLGIDGFEIGIPTLTRKDLDLCGDDIIFMNLQNSAKLNPHIIKLQLEIIKKIPNSYLLTKLRKKQDHFLKDLMIDLAKRENISEEKLKFISGDSNEQTHRANIKIADVILDTYPYNGSTTTLEALWQELPMVTRVGEQFASRNSYTYMMNAGITEGIAWSDEEYIEWGIKLGTDENLRKEVSWKLKQSKKISPLWNGKQFTKEMEKAYQQMWEIYINS